jgi:hypothetical protein
MGYDKIEPIGINEIDFQYQSVKPKRRCCRFDHGDGDPQQPQQLVDDIPP